MNYCALEPSGSNTSATGKLPFSRPLSRSSPPTNKISPYGDILFVGTEGLEPPKSRGRLVYSEEQLPLCDVPVASCVVYEKTALRATGRFDWSQRDLNHVTSGLKKPALCQLSYSPKKSREAESEFALLGLEYPSWRRETSCLYCHEDIRSLLAASASP